MIEYVQLHNPDDRVLKKASQILSEENIICFPTDTSWILAACITKKKAIEKLYKIKHENDKKHFSILCNDISRATEVAQIDNNAFKILKKIIPGNYTFIFEATKQLAKQIKASKTDKEVGVRFVPSILVNKLIEIHGELLISTNIPKSLFNNEDQIYSYMLEDSISHLTDLIIDPGEFEFSGESTIINLANPGRPQVVREGSGDFSLFQ